MQFSAASALNAGGRRPPTPWPSPAEGLAGGFDLMVPVLEVRSMTQRYAAIGLQLRYSVQT